MSSMIPFIVDKLNLKVNRSKSQTVYIRKVKFLGANFYEKKEERLRIRRKSLTKMKAKLGQLSKERSPPSVYY